MVKDIFNDLVAELYHTINEIEFLEKAQVKDELEEDIKSAYSRKRKIEKKLLKLKESIGE